MNQLADRENPGYQLLASGTWVCPVGEVKKLGSEERFLLRISLPRWWAIFWCGESAMTPWCDR